jgi:hypothetical protein
MPTDAETWWLVKGWREAEKMNELFCTLVTGLPMASAKELGPTSRNDRVMKCWLTMLKACRINPLRDALEEHMKEGETIG